jgi:hypothetical protein
MGEKCMQGFGGENVKRLLGSPKRIYADNIKMDLRERIWGDMDWNHLAQDRGE